MAEKKRGRGGSGNFPNARNKELMETPEGREAISRVVGEVLEAFKMPRIKSDDELSERIADYFERCVTKKILPTVEEMWLYTGYYRSWAGDVLSGKHKGFSPNTAIIIKKALETMASIDGKLAADGEINAIIYIFRAKNYYGMVDKQEVGVSPTIGEQSIDAAAIREKYLGNSDAPATLPAATFDENE